MHCHRQRIGRFTVALLLVGPLCAGCSDDNAAGSEDSDSASDATRDSTAPDGDTDSDTDTDTDTDTDADSDTDTDSDTDSDTDTAPSDCPSGCIEACLQGCFDLGSCNGDPLALHPNIHTIGVVFDGVAGETAEIYYRSVGAPYWMKGHDAVRIPDGRLVSSVFYLKPDRHIEVMLRNDDTVACGTTTTQKAVLDHETVRTLYVDSGADPGGDGREAAPFATISQAVNAASAGADIVVRAGIYTESVSITDGGEEDRRLRILAEDGAVMDGSDADVLVEGLPWTPAGDNVYTTAFDDVLSYLTRDDDRFYHYTSLDGLESGLGDDDVPIEEGWYIDSGTLYVRTSTNPDQHLWHLSRYNTAIALDGASWVWIEGLEIRHFGQGDYPKGIDIRASDHIVVRRNHIHATNSPIWARRDAEYLRIEENDIHQSGMSDWPWDAMKGTDHEDTGINIAGAGHTIVRGNRVGHMFNGIGSGSFDDDQNTAVAFDVDVYDNQLGDINDDGLEPEGACVNNRFWNNTVDTLHNGISLAPITFGPVWVMHNRFTDFEAGGIKVSNSSSGRVWIYHNTSYTGRADHNGMTVSGPFENMVFRNNIFYGTRYAFEMSREALPNDLDYDSFFTTRGAPVMKWDDVRYDSLADMCAATGLECHGLDEDPSLLDPGSGQFGLTAASPNVDSALRIYGINDVFEGTGPDLGYRELGAAEPPRFE
jgi:hypothetical protein